ncbi:MAG: AIR synthase-related protein, partial [Gemmatimonadaceae bacterium]
NLDRALPNSLDAVVSRASWKTPTLFAQLGRAGAVPDDEMFRTFNMGVGMVVICDDSDAREVVRHAASAGIAGWRMGTVRPGSGRVVIE